MTYIKQIHTCPHCGFDDPVQDDKKDDKRCHFCGNVYKSTVFYNLKLPEISKECAACGNKNVGHINGEFGYECRICGFKFLE